MKIVFVILIVLATCLGCSQNNNTTQPKAQTEDTTHYFQVAEYIKKQIEEVEKTPYYIYKKEVRNGVADSLAINTPIFVQMAQEFVKADINKPTIKKNYIENIFHDQTTKSFTISYTTPNKDLEVQNIEVLLKEDGQTLQRIFIRKFLDYPDSSVIEQLSWKADESFQINRLVQMPDKKENSQQTTVVWNDKN